MTGVTVQSLKATGYELFQGIVVDMGQLAASTYTVKIESPSYIDVIKFIKTN